MPTLEITVRWLTEGTGAAYHGEEWPPSPSRLFRALLAGAMRPGGSAGRGMQALQRLESRPPPQIEAPLAECLEPITTSVPNNDGDVIAGAEANRRPAEARRLASKLRTLRRRPGWRVPPRIRYRWVFNERDPDPEAFQALAEGLTLLGQGTDLAFATAQWHRDAPAATGPVWRPNANGPVEMPVPSNGEVERLETIYSARRSRIGSAGVLGTREPPANVTAYIDPLAPPLMRRQAFRVQGLPGEGPWSIAGTDLARLAAMVRGAIHQAAKTSGLEQSQIAELMGHGGNGRLHVLPLPNVGHAHADGRIRRVLLAAPAGLPEDQWQAVLLRLTGAELFREGSPDPVALLTPITDIRSDRILSRFLGPADHWTTASPIILPGFHHRRGKPRPARAVRQLLQHAHIPSEAVRHVDLLQAAELAACARSGDYFVPQHLRERPRAFARIQFHRPVAGPLFLGAGKSLGLGLLVVCEHSGGDRKPGEHSRN